MTRKFIFILLPLLISLFFIKGCFLEEFDTIPLNIPVDLPFVLNDPVGFDSISAQAPFTIDTNKIFLDYKGKMKSLSLAEMAIRFSEAQPTDLQGTLRFTLRKSNASGDIIINQILTGFNPATYLHPNAPYILDLTQEELEVMSGFLAQNGTSFYGEVSLTNVTPAFSQKNLKGFVDMLFVAEVEY
jgi:hypothetical protein